MRCPNCQSANNIAFKFCANCGAKLPVSPSDERRVVTTLFANVAGLNVISEQRDPEHVSALLGEVFGVLEQAVSLYDGTIDKHIGDAIMVLFGAPLAHEDDPARALRCALSMQSRLAEYNASHAAELPQLLNLHIGINTGLVLAGQVGATNKSYSVMGDAVNLAARLEGLSGPGEILVGEATWQLTGSLFEWVDLGSVKIRGKAEPVILYRLLGAKGLTNQLRGTWLHSPLVGRSAELATLRRAIAGAQVRKGSFVAVFGEAGLGKSRLIEEAVDEAVSQLPTAPAFGRCLSYGANLDYQPWQEVLRALLGVEAEGSVGAQEQLDRSLDAVGFGEDARDRQQIGHILGLAASEGDPSQQAAAAASAIAALCRTLTASHPLVIVLEDLHWADGPSLRLLQAVVPLLADLPLLLVVICRPQGEAADLLRGLIADDGGGRWEAINLQPLGNAASEELVANLLGSAELPEAVRLLVEERADGNPFYVEECVRTLIDRGWLVRGVDGWAVASSDVPPEVPATLQGIIGARIDGLPEAARRSLQVASVLGRRFRPLVLGALDGAAAQESNLLLLTEREMVLVERDEYLFRHSLTQEVAYGTLLLERRRLYHIAAAEYYRRSFALTLRPGGVRALADLASLLNAAYHYAAAGSYVAAYDLLEEPLGPAADGNADDSLYQRLYLWGEYATLAELLGRLISLPAQAALESTAQVKVLSNLGLAYNYLGEGERALACYNQAMALARELGDSARVSNIYNRMGIVYAMRGDLAQAMVYYQGALAAAEQAGDAVAVSRALTNLGRSSLMLGRLMPAREYGERALALAEAGGDPGVQEGALNNLGVICAALGQTEAAVVYYHRALAIAEERGHQRGQVAVLNDLGAARLSLGDVAAATAMHQRALQIAVECDDRDGRVSALSHLGEDYTASHDYPLALDYHAGAQALVEDSDQFERGAVASALGSTYLALGRAEEALAQHQVALAWFEQVQNKPRLARTHSTLATDYLALDQPAAALAQAEQAAEISAELGAPLMLASAQHLIGIAQQRAGNLPAARAAYATAHDLRTLHTDPHAEESLAALHALDALP